MAVITYNGRRTEVAAGQTATMNCGGKVTTADIQVDFDTGGSVTYNGTETEIGKGKTAILNCEGKRMRTNVVVEAILVAGLYDENDNLLADWDTLNLDIERDYDSLNVYSYQPARPYFAFKNISNYKIIVPNGIVKIGTHAFSGCNGMVSIVIPDSVRTIGERAFVSCSNLTNIKLPQSMISIGEGVFQNCKSLQNIEIPTGISTIGRSAFKSCETLRSVVMPDSIEGISHNAFDYCYELKDIYYRGTPTQWYAIEELPGTSFDDTFKPTPTIHYNYTD